MKKEKNTKTEFINIYDELSLLSKAIGNENVDTILRYIYPDLYNVEMGKDVLKTLVQNTLIQFNGYGIITNYDDNADNYMDYAVLEKYIKYIDITETTLDKLILAYAYREYKYILLSLISAFKSSPDGKIPKTIVLINDLKQIIKLFDNGYKVLDWDGLMQKYVQCIVDDILYIADYDISEDFPVIKDIVNK